MKKLSSKLFALIYVIGTMSFAHATDVVPMNELSRSSDIDKVLSQLSYQNSLSPALFQTSNEPSSLAANSSLMSVNNLADINSNNDMLSHLTLVASNAVKLFKQKGRASWYGGKFHGRKTASGERFNMNSMTAAHKSLPFNTFLKVTNNSNGQSVIVKVNDRGPFHGNRIIDLSYGAAKKIGLVKHGVANVSIEKVAVP